jgi:hypothetical protein
MIVDGEALGEGRDGRHQTRHIERDANGGRTAP